MASTTFWMTAAMGAAATGIVAYVYLRRRHVQPPEVTANRSTVASTSSSAVHGFRLPRIKKLIRERKMVFVVNRVLVPNKQLLFTGVSTACLWYYRSIKNNSDYYDTHVKPWTRTGQMKVVLKANNGEELLELLEKCRQQGLEATVLNLGDLKANASGSDQSNKKVQKSDDPNTPAIFCVLAPTDKLDQITGHLKLL